MSRNAQPPDFDLDEDLFDFAAVAGESEAGAESVQDLEEVLASFRDTPPEDLLAPALAAPVSTPVMRAPPDPLETAAEHRLQATEPPVPKSSARAPAPARQASVETPAAEDAPLSRPGSRRARRLSTSVVAIALSVTALNSILALVVLRGRPGSGDEVRAVGSEREPYGENEPSTRHAQTAAQTGEENALSYAERPGDPEPSGELFDHPALEQARGEVSRGEYAAARQRVYALLSVIDRLEDPRREGLEAECQFLIAQALHLEALERMGRSD